MKNYVSFIARKRQEYDNFDESELSAQFVPYYESGQRIEVECHIEGIKRGTVGVTTGWKPVFLLMLRSNSTGSSITLSDKDRIVKIVR